jgi:hypothetical protein
MTRALSIATASAALAAAGLLVPVSALAQTPAHDHAAAADHAHHHATAPVDCTMLGAPPWAGLPDADRQRMSVLERAVAHLETPEAARAAGFVPALGNIPGMGIHYVHLGRVMAPIAVEEPHHLMFAPVEGEHRLVGAAYAFVDRVDTDRPLPFDSELAHWHDHPEVAPPGQTLHMLHVWFVPSSSGPFSGLNFWLPFMAFGVEPPSGCWLEDEGDAQRIQRVAFALATVQGDGLSMSGRSGAGLAAAFQGSRDFGAILEAIASISEEAQLPPPSISDLPPSRVDALRAMDAAARAGERVAWANAADRFLADLSRAENATVDGLLRTLTHAQMSTPERDAARTRADGPR